MVDQNCQSSQWSPDVVDIVLGLQNLDFEDDRILVLGSCALNNSTEPVVTMM
jgi:hypothetical protein